MLGSGEAGKYIAWTLARKGMKTAVIERKYIGGSCPNIACLPSKNVIHSAKVASYFRRSEEFGITKDNWKIDMPAVRERKRKMVTGLVEMHLDLYKKSGAELVKGSGRFVGPSHEHCFATTGSQSGGDQHPIGPSMRIVEARPSCLGIRDDPVDFCWLLGATRP